jgi:hypothetical protein
MPVIQIQAPRQGIAQSPHVGFAEVVNIDVNSIPGIAKLNNIMVKKSSTTVTAQINWIVRHPITTTEIYALDNAGTVYKSADSGATWAVLAGSSSTNAHGNGLLIWKNYLFVARDAKLDVCGDGSATGIIAANWTLDWQDIDSDVLWHPMLTSVNDNKLYGGAGRFIFSLDENTGKTFAPGTSDTFTFTVEALDLPPSYRIKCLEELGNNLMIGTWQGTSVTDIRVANIYSWDRSSVSFGQPIVMAEYGVHAMKNIGNSLVVLAGTSGTIYRCDGVNAIIVGQLPMDLTGGKYLEWYPSSICSYKSKVFFGVGQGGTTAISGMGVYSLQQTGKGNILSLEHTVSTLNTGASKPLKPSALLPVTRDTLLVAWRDDATYGIDLTTATSYAYSSDYSGYFVTPLYTVGSNLNQFKFTQMEFQLARPLRSGEGIKLEYRLDLTASFTEIGTYDYATWGAITSKNLITELPNDVKACEQIQFKISLLGSSTTSPELKVVFIK